MLTLHQRSTFTKLVVQGSGVKPAMDFEGLLWCVEEAGCTAVFEWIGRSARMKVKERGGKVVLLQVRNMVTGEYVPQEEVARWAEMFGVESVVRRTDLEGKTFKGVFGEVKGEVFWCMQDTVQC